MKISDSLAPEANRFDWKGLTSKERTAPVCCVILAIVASELDLQVKDYAMS